MVAGAGDGLSEIKVECNTWVKHRYLDRLEEYLKKLGDNLEKIGEETRIYLEAADDSFNRPLTKQDVDMANRAVAEAVTKNPRAVVKSSCSLNATEQNPIIDSSLDPPASEATPTVQVMNRINKYSKPFTRPVMGTAADDNTRKPANAAFEDGEGDKEESEFSDNSLFYTELTDTDDDSESGQQDVAEGVRLLKGGHLVDM